MALPDVTAKLTADVSQFVQAWARAAAAAKAAAAEIKSAMESVDNIDASGIARFRSEVDKVGESAGRAREGLRGFGDDARQAGSGADKLGESAKKAGDALGGGGGGGGIVGGATRSRAALALMGAGITVLVSMLPAVAAAALAAGAGLQAMGVVAGIVVAGWKGISDAADVLKGRLAQLKAQLENTFQQGLTQEFSKLGQAIAGLSSPINNIANSVVGVVSAFTGWIRSTQGLSEIRELLGGVDNMVKQLAPGAEQLAKAFTGFGAAAAPSLGKIGEALTHVAKEINDVIQKAKETGQLQKAFEAGADAVSAFGDILGALLEILIDVAASGGEPAADAMHKFAGALKDAAPTIAQFFKMLAQMVQIVSTVVGWFAKLLAALDPVMASFDKSTDATTKFLKALDPKKIDEFGKAVAGFVLKIAKDLKDGFDKAVETVKKWWDDTKKTVKEGVDSAVKFVKELPDKAKQALDKFVEDAKQQAKKWGDNLVQTVKQGVTDAIAAIKELPQKAKDALSQWGQDLAAAAKEAWDKLKAAVEQGVTDAVEAVKKLPEKAKQALDTWKGDMEKAGKDAGDGLGKGLESAINNVVQIATQMAQAAMDAIKQTLGIMSPSIVMRDQVGKMMGAGLAQGILASQGLVNDSMHRLGSGAVGAGRASAGAGGGGRGGQLTLVVSGGADSAAGTFIARLAQQGKLKITSRAIVGA